MSVLGIISSVSMGQHFIRVGIKTAGQPVLKPLKDYTLLENMLIGDGFHWQRKIRAKLPGEVIPFIEESQKNTEEPLSPIDDAHITLINSIPLETYLQCVVGSEMNPEAPVEFLKAHAVISRSWALGKIIDVHHRENKGKINADTVMVGWDDTAGHQGFHVCSDDHCQRYQGLQTIPDITLSAIKETAGEVLLSSEGNLLDSRFSKCCGGQTETFPTCWQPVEVDCLESFTDPWCNLSSLNPVVRRTLLSSILKSYDHAMQGYGYRWQTEISKRQIEKNLKEKFGRNIGEIQRLQPLQRGGSGRISLLRIYGSEGFLDLGKELWIRRLLSSSHLYSSAFEVEDKGSFVVLSGKGWGHGVGLCQIGAANMAFNGKNYREILSFYYPGSEIAKV